MWNDKHLEGPTFQRFEIRNDLNGDVYASKAGRSPPSRLGLPVAHARTRDQRRHLAFSERTLVAVLSTQFEDVVRAPRLSDSSGSRPTTSDARSNRFSMTTSGGDCEINNNAGGSIVFGSRWRGDSRSFCTGFAMIQQGIGLLVRAVAGQPCPKKLFRPPVLTRSYERGQNAVPTPRC